MGHKAANYSLICVQLDKVKDPGKGTGLHHAALEASLFLGGSMERPPPQGGSTGVEVSQRNWTGKGKLSRGL